MSYSIVKGIRINTAKNEVYFKAACNNIYPRSYIWHSETWYSEYLQKHGKTALEILIIDTYLSGSFQAGIKNKYSRAADKLQKLPNFKKFYGWSGTKRDGRMQDQKYKEIILVALNQKRSTGKFAIKMTLNSNDVFVLRVLKRGFKYVHDLDNAKIFKYRDDAMQLINDYKKYDAEIIVLN